MSDEKKTEGDEDAVASEMEKKIEEMNVTVKERFDSTLQSARAEVNAKLEHSIGEKIASVSSSYQEQRRDQVNVRQTDIMRVNKIFRDVARTLGENWRPVFGYLTSALPEATVSFELSKLERQKATLQAYKALTTWKDLVGESFDMKDLERALEEHELHDLAKMVQATMQADNVEDLLKREAPGEGKGIVSGVRRASSTEAGDGETAKTDTKPALLDGPHLLRLAKAIGGSWTDFARALQTPEDEVQEILQSEGMTYRGCFQILWLWKDRGEDNVVTDNKVVLEEALNKTGHGDLMKILYT